MKSGVFKDKPHFTKFSNREAKNFGVEIQHASDVPLSFNIHLTHFRICGNNIVPKFWII